MLDSPGLEHLSNGGSDLKYGNSDCYSPKLFSTDPRDYKGKTDWYQNKLDTIFGQILKKLTLGTLNHDKSFLTLANETGARYLYFPPVGARSILVN